jgi:M6 family metalloprotease-like protein
MSNPRIGLLVVVALLCAAQVEAARRGERERNVQRAAETATPALLVGRLEMVWGDPDPTDPRASGAFKVTLVDDAGGRHPLDPEQALAAAEELHALFGRRVAVSTVPVAAKRGGAGGRSIDAIVPIGDLVASKAAEAPAKVAGVTRWITLGCRFSDVAATSRDRNYFQSIYGTAPTQLGHYWDEVSYGKISLAGSIAQDWKTLPQTRAFYVPIDPATNKEDADLSKLFTDCVALHDPDVDFSVNGGAQGVNLVFNDNLDGSAWGGSRCVTLDGINKCWSTTWLPPWSYEGTATMGHEMGHAYGLPHANNSDDDGWPYDSPWDVMSDSRRSNSVLDSVYGRLPKHLNMYSRNRLGWVDAPRKLDVPAGSGVQTVTLDRANLRGSTRVQMITLSYPGVTNRYFTIEARKIGGTYEAAMPGDAVIVHEVLTSRGEPAWSQDADVPPATYSNNEGSMFKVGETWVAPDRAFRVTVVSATADGFVVRIRPAPKKGGPGQLVPAG